MLRSFRAWLLFGILFFNLSHTVFALEIPARPDGHVTDKANLLSPQSKEKLEKFLDDFERKTSNQIVVVTFPSLEGESLEDFSIRLAERWRIGQKSRDNGVIFLIFKDDHKMRIEVGYGLEGVLPDALAGQIIQQVAAPYFRRGEYENGIFSAVDAICRATQGEFKGSGESFGANREGDSTFKFILIFIFIISIIDFIRYSGYFWKYHADDHRYGFLEWWFRFAFLLFLLQLIFRILFTARLYSGGGYSGSQGGSGGFSGGGGSFGGGGASGSW